MITSSEPFIIEGVIHIPQSRKYQCKYVDLVERRVIKIGKDWVKTGAWRIE